MPLSNRPGVWRRCATGNTGSSTKCTKTALASPRKCTRLYGREEWRLEQELPELCDIANLCRDLGMDIVKKIYQHFDTTA